GRSDRQSRHRRVGEGDVRIAIARSGACKNGYGLTVRLPRAATLHGMPSAASDLLEFVGESRFGTVLADPPWQFVNRTGKIAPEHRGLSRYSTRTVAEIMELPVSHIVQRTAHLYLWVPNALLPDGLAVMKAWGFTYKSNLVWHKIRKDGGSDGRGVG